MAFGIAILIASIVGIFYGILKKNKLIAILSIVVLLMTIAVWVYFYNNPY